MRKNSLTIRQRVRVYLAKNDMTQGELAARLGLSDARLSLILSGKSVPSLEEGFRLENITGIPAKAFIRKVA